MEDVVYTWGLWVSKGRGERGVELELGRDVGFNTRICGRTWWMDGLRVRKT